MSKKTHKQDEHVQNLTQATSKANGAQGFGKAKDGLTLRYELLAIILRAEALSPCAAWTAKFPLWHIHPNTRWRRGVRFL